MSRNHTQSDTRQLSLLDAIAAAEALRHRPAAPSELGDLEEKVRRSLAEGIHRSPLSRWQLAGEVSSLLGREISKHMVDKYTSAEAPHHCPPDVLAAICRVLGWREPLCLLSEAAGLFCLPGPEALRAEIRRLEEAERKARSEKKKREAFLAQMEGGNHG